MVRRQLNMLINAITIMKAFITMFNSHGSIQETFSKNLGAEPNRRPITAKRLGTKIYCSNLPKQ